MNMYRPLVAALLSVIASGHAAAAFYVDDEAPQQLAIAMKPTIATKTLYLTFSPKRGWLSLSARRDLADQLSTFAAASDINIVASSASPNNAKLAEQRIASVHQWLVDNGISGNRISFADDPDKRPREQAGTVTLTLTVRSAPVSPAVTAPRAINASLSRPLLAAPVVMHPPQDAAPGHLDDKTKLALLQRIVSMGKNKIVKTEDAFILMAEVLAMQDLAPAAPPPPPLIAPLPSALPSIASMIAADVPRQWTLDNTKTLRANLDDWTSVAGYEPLNWQSPNQYSVGAMTLSGNFYQALTDLAKAAPTLNFTLSKARRTLTVSEAQ